MADNEILNLILESVNSLKSEMKTTNDKLNMIEGGMDKIEGRMGKIEGRMDKIEGGMDKIEGRMDKVDSKLSMLEVWQKKTSQHVEELHVAQKLFELNTNKKLARLQDGMDTVEEILKLNDLIPR